MSQRPQFRSRLASALGRYVALKQALGRCFVTASWALGRLDRFLASRNAPDLTKETFSAWCSSMGNVTPGTRRGRMRIVYLFCLYRRRTEPDCFVPDPSQFPPPQPRPLPHIFTEKEIGQILLATENLSFNFLSPLRRQVARLAVVLLYTTGMRRGEVVRLTMGDYDPGERLLAVRDTKFHKSRLVPLSDDGVVEMNRYLRDRQKAGFPRGIDTPLLINRHHRNCGGYTGAGFAGLLRKVFHVAGVQTSRRRPPRVHDFRFTFAVHALRRWYRAGVDVQARLPSLSIYMGHVSVLSTQYYLTFLDEVAQAVNQRFEQHCSEFLVPEDPIGGTL